MARQGTNLKGKVMTEVIKRIKVTDLVLDYSLYPRHHLDDYHTREMVEAINAGVIFPPIVADKASMRVVDGFHRARAYRRKYGTEAEIDAILRKYASEADMFEDAMKLNSAHGRNLTAFDKARSIRRAQDLEISEERTVKALNITHDRYAQLIQQHWSADGEVLKYTLSHMAGKDTTQEQRDFNIGKAGGMDQLFYINQVIALLETGSIDWERERVKVGLRRLYEILEKKLSVVGV